MNETQSITVETIDNIADALRSFFAAEECPFTAEQERALAGIHEVRSWTEKASA